MVLVRKLFNCIVGSIVRFYNNTIEQKKSLRDHLTQQLNIDINSAEDKLIGKMFINTLDGNGYINEEDLKKIYHKFTGFEFNFNKTFSARFNASFCCGDISTFLFITNFSFPGI